MTTAEPREPYADRFMASGRHRRATDEGNALRFVDICGDVVRRLDSGEWAVCGSDNLWTISDSDEIVLDLARYVAHTIYAEAQDSQAHVIDEDDDTPEQLARWAHASGSLARIRAMTDQAKGDVRIAATKASFDANPNLIVAKDVVIELACEANLGKPSTRYLRRDDLATMSTSARWDPSLLASPPESVRKFLETFVPDARRQTMLFRLLGNCIVGGNAARLLLILFGPTTTGKSQLTEAIDNTMGGYSRTTNPSVFHGSMDDRPRPDLLEVLPRRMIFLNESSRGWKIHADRIKDIAGGAPISVRAMRSNRVQNVVPSFTGIFVTNEMPTIVGADPATRRRLIGADFNRVLAKGLSEDPGVKEAFVHDPDVQAWLLARLVQGQVEAHREGLGAVFDEFRASTEMATAGLSHVQSFIEWLTETGQLEVIPENGTEYGDKSSFMTKAALYERYKWWIDRHGDLEDKRGYLSQRDLNRELKDDPHHWEDCKAGSWRWSYRRLHGSIVDLEMGGPFS